MTPFDHAFAARDLPALEAALREQPEPPRLFNGWNVLQMACHMNWLEAVDALPPPVRAACIPPERGREPLALASRHGWGLLVALVERGLAAVEPQAVAEGLSEPDRRFWQAWQQKRDLTQSLAAPHPSPGATRARQRM